MSVASRSSIRQDFGQIRASLSSQRREEASRLALKLYLEKRRVLSFASFGDEIDLWPLNQKLAEKGELILPRVEGKCLGLYLVKDLEVLVLSSWGILEPEPELCERISPNEIQTALIPGLAFDSHNHRLGYGKGFYDRLLPHLTNAEKIGIGYAEQRLEETLLIHEEDAPLDSLSLF